MTTYEDLRLKRNEVYLQMLDAKDKGDAEEEQRLNAWHKELSLATEEAYNQEIKTN